MRFEYDSRHEPPAPVLPVQVGPPGNSESNVTLEALIDTDSDLSGIPIPILRRLRIAPFESAITVDFDGIRTQNPLYIVSIRVGGLQLSHVPMLGLRGDEPFLGRNILNELDVNLNGPARQLTIY